MSIRLVPSIVAIGLVSASSAVPAQSVYKWTDAQGSVHYTDQPPPVGRPASTIKLKDSVAAPAASSAGVSPASNTNAAAPASAALAEAEAAARKRNCQSARANLATLSGRALLVDGNDPATAKRLDASQREAAKQAAQNDIANYCDGEAR